jgi:transcriptional regulator with XRE-family HTH domain
MADEEVAAGRLVLAAQLPPPAARRQLREAQGLTRPQVAELVGVSKEAIRLWESGEHEPAGDNRAAYTELLTRWQSGPQKPTEPAAEVEPARASSAVPVPSGTPPQGEVIRLPPQSVQAWTEQRAAVNGEALAKAALPVLSEPIGIENPLGRWESRASPG